MEINRAPLVWQSLLQRRVAFFAWRLMLRKTPTLSWVQSIGISSASRCFLCKSSTESDIHHLFFYPFAASIWSWVLKAAGVRSPSSFSPTQIWYDLSFDCDKFARKGTSSILFTTAFVIWKCRNDYIFDNVRASQTKAQIHLSELLSFSLRRIDKPFSGKPLQNFCNFICHLLL